MHLPETIIKPDEPILVTGAAGFIGAKVVEHLISRGYSNVRCLARLSGNSKKLQNIIDASKTGAGVQIVNGNLLSREDCARVTRGVSLIYHLAAGRGEKSFPDAFMNSVVTTRNLLDAALQEPRVKRFVSVSSFSVYSNRQRAGGVLDEKSSIETEPELRGDAYTFAKVKQDEVIAEYQKKFGLPAVVVRPGFVYGPGNEAITGRVGINPFGLFLHLGGSNRIPFTYVDNCAEAIVLAGLTPGIDGEVFNVVDDELPSSRQFLRLYKKNVRRFPSIYVPHLISYLVCYLWEKYSTWSEGQLPPAFNRRIWHSFWKRTRYSNAKLKQRLGWMPRIPMQEALARYFDSCRQKQRHA